MSVQYGTVTSISEINDPIFASVEIDGTRFSVDNTKPDYTAPDVRVGDRVSYRVDVYGHLLYIDVVQVRPTTAEDAQRNQCGHGKSLDLICGECEEGS